MLVPAGFVATVLAAVLTAASLHPVRVLLLVRFRYIRPLADVRGERRLVPSPCSMQALFPRV